MKYSIMRMLCMFDLPVDTESEKRAYRIFRKELLREGFIMIQYSVYMRTCPNRDYCRRLEKRIQRIAPDKGNIRLITITEKQYEDMKLIIGSKKETEEAIGSGRIIII